MRENTNYIVEINNFKQYVQFIKKYCAKNKIELWYRGHRSNLWELKPNLYRNSIKKYENSDEIITLKYDFVDFKEEFYTFKEKVKLEKLFDISRLNDFQIMFLAQHYGLLTPTLDWTTDPLVALFFALDGYYYNENIFPVIYIFKPGFCNANAFIRHNDNSAIVDPVCVDDFNDLVSNWCNDLNNTPFLHIPIAIFSKIDFSYRMCRQSGKFTFHGAVGPLSYSWNDIMIENKKFIEAIKINPKAVNEMKEYLTALDINEKTIYRNPTTTLDRKCSDIKEQFIQQFEKKLVTSIKNSCKTVE